MTDRPRIYLAFDPGKATGVAAWFPDTPTYRFGKQLDPAQMHNFLDEMVGEWDIQKVQCEWFTIDERTIRTDIDYNALHLIGAIKHVTTIHGIPLEFTRPDQVKARFPDKALKQAGWWDPSDHVRDATRHLMYMLVNEELIDPRIFLL